MVSDHQPVFFPNKSMFWGGAERPLGEPNDERHSQQPSEEQGTVTSQRRRNVAVAAEWFSFDFGKFLKRVEQQRALVEDLGAQICYNTAQMARLQLAQPNQVAALQAQQQAQLQALIKRSFAAKAWRRLRGSSVQLGQEVVWRDEGGSFGETKAATNPETSTNSCCYDRCIHGAWLWMDACTCAWKHCYTWANQEKIRKASLAMLLFNIWWRVEAWQKEMVEREETPAQRMERMSAMMLSVKLSTWKWSVIQLDNIFRFSILLYNLYSFWKLCIEFQCPFRIVHMEREKDGIKTTFGVKARAYELKKRREVVVVKGPALLQLPFLRQDERKAVVQEKLYQQWRAGIDDLRTMDSKIVELQTIADRDFQLDDKALRKAEDRNEETAAFGMFYWLLERILVAAAKGWWKERERERQMQDDASHYSHCWKRVKSQKVPNSHLLQDKGIDDFYAKLWQLRLIQKVRPTGRCFWPFLAALWGRIVISSRNIWFYLYKILWPFLVKCNNFLWDKSDKNINMFTTSYLLMSALTVHGGRRSARGMRDTWPRLSEKSERRHSRMSATTCRILRARSRKNG